jgi:hypothetical protein
MGVAVFSAMTAASPASAAVVPVLDDGLAASAGGGPRAALLAQTLLTMMTGKWTGQTGGGHNLNLVLRVEGGVLVGTVTGLGSEASDIPLPLTRLMLSGRTMVFSVKAKACTNPATYGVLTFVSGQSARLDLQSGAAPFSVKLTKVG